MYKSNKQLYTTMTTKHVIINDEIVSLEFIRGFSKVDIKYIDSMYKVSSYSFEIHYLNKGSHTISVLINKSFPKDILQENKIYFLADQDKIAKEKALKLRETLSKLATGQNELKELVSDENGNWNLK